MRQTGIELIQIGKCPVNATSPIACMFCPYGHMLECHYPKTCAEAVCSHYQAETTPFDPDQDGAL